MESFLLYIREILYRLLFFLRTSWISIILILLIFLLTTLDQSDTIIIDLLDNNSGESLKPLVILIFVFLLMALSFIVSHYPVYLEIRRRETSNSSLTWSIEHLFLGWGFVTYDEPTNTNPWAFKVPIRNIWGHFLLAAVFYILVTAHTRNINLNFNNESYQSLLMWLQMLLFISFSLGVYFSIEKFSPHQTDIIRKRIVIYSFGLFLLHCLISLSLITLQGWSSTTYWWFYFLLYTASLFYSAFRINRKFTFFKKETNFLKLIATSGFLSLGVVLYAHFDVFYFNPLVILLAQFNLFYGMVIIPIKHYYYYRQGNIGPIPTWKRIVFLWFFPIYFPLLIIWGFLAGIIGNDLHSLPIMQESSHDVVDFKHFVDGFDSSFYENETVFFIASFGGGLKANIWNQLILDSLTHYGATHQNIVSHTIALSGVSGGAIGHAVFTGLYSLNDTTKGKEIQSHKKEIEELGNTNFLSLDLTYLLGQDLLFEFFPNFILNWLCWPNDRAKRAMVGYDDFVSKKINVKSNLLEKTFRNFWAQLYKKEKREGRFFPALIANGAATNIQRGIACSVKMNDALFASTFYDSADLLNYQGDTTSLPFFYAASCTNRFPIFSPAAKIKEKGHFIDGGYFENSGMLSLQDFARVFRDSSEQYKKGEGPSVVFIQIINGKQEYLKSLLKHKAVGVDSKIKDQRHWIKKTIKESTELGSILGTVTSISFMPSYMMTKYENDPNYVQIQLPYYITQNDINDLFHSKSVKLDPICQARIDRSNAMITSFIKGRNYDFVQPPLARLLGRQAVNYMEAALKQKNTWDGLDQILLKSDKRPVPLDSEILKKL